MPSSSTLAAMAALILAASPAFAETETIVTARAGESAPAPANGAAAQVRSWIAEATPPDLEAGLDGVIPDGPRQVHGEVGFGVGTGGYRSAYAVGAFPIGKRSGVTIAVGQSRGRGGGYGRDGSPPGFASAQAACGGAFGFGPAVSRCGAYD